MIRLGNLVTSAKNLVPFYHLAQERTLTVSDPQLIVSKQYGFLPRETPLTRLPSDFEALDTTLKSMVIRQPDGRPGLLAEGGLGPFVHSSLPQYDVSQVQDTRTLEALMRDYCFLTSAYLLEPCDLNFRKTGKYGLGREVLPKNIAVPLCHLADKLGVRPFTEYTHYILSNWRLKHPEEGFHPSNVEFIRRFEGGPDEFWFMAIHLFMLEKSGQLVEVALDLLQAAEAGDRATFDHALIRQAFISGEINNRINRMWDGFNRKAFDDFRTFIMGIKNQPMFPNGVRYEGVSDEPRFYRGPSGANDSIVPTLDNLFEVTANMPNNDLIATLKDFRSYRPKEHQLFVDGLEKKAREVGVRRFAEADPNSTVLYLSNLDQIAEFRERHWRLTKHYIVTNSAHPVATGGSPISSYLPNQLGVVLDMIQEVAKGINQSLVTPANQELLSHLVRRANAMRKTLKREVEQLNGRPPIVSAAV